VFKLSLFSAFHPDSQLIEYPGGVGKGILSSLFWSLSEENWRSSWQGLVSVALTVC